MIIEEIQNGRGEYGLPVKIIVDLKNKASIKKVMQAWVDEFSEISKHAEQEGSEDELFIEYGYMENDEFTQYPFEGEEDMFDASISEIAFWNAASEHEELIELAQQHVEQLIDHVKEYGGGDLSICWSGEAIMGLVGSYFFALKHKSFVPIHLKYFRTVQSFAPPEIEFVDKILATWNDDHFAETAYLESIAVMFPKLELSPEQQVRYDELKKL